MATCRDCKLFDLDACKDKAGRVRKDRVGKCLWVSREAWPLSVEGRYGNRRPSAFRMQPDDGNGCKCFQKREDAR